MPSLSHSHSHQLTHRLGFKQSQTMRMILSHVQSLRSPAPTSSIKGIPGIAFAHKFLQEKNLRGILIGGMLRSLWGRALNYQDFETDHKDVDVLLLSEVEHIGTEWEGIDWWWPVTKEVTYFRNGVWEKPQVTCWQNVNEVTLSFQIENCFSCEDSLSLPGLYIPPPEFYANMRIEEARSIARFHYEGTNVVVENLEEVLESIERKILKQGNSKINNVIPRHFGKEYFRFILSENYNSSRFSEPRINGFQDVELLHKLVNFESFKNASSQKDAKAAILI